jgi:uncharacterized protein (DUF2235 family)
LKMGQGHNFDVKQVWFAGAHADVGGGYKESESGLSKITLSWMLSEASECGFLVDGTKVLSLLPVVSDPSGSAAAEPSAIMHDELTHFRWKCAQFVPRRYWSRTADGSYRRSWIISPRPRSRTIPKNARIHRSVLLRLQQVPTYKPDNLAETMQDETGVLLDRLLHTRPFNGTHSTP